MKKPACSESRVLRLKELKILRDKCIRIATDSASAVKRLERWTCAKSEYGFILRVICFNCRNSSWSQQLATSEPVTRIEEVDTRSRLEESNQKQTKKKKEADKAAPKINSGATDGGILYR